VADLEQEVRTERAASKPSVEPTAATAPSAGPAPKKAAPKRSSAKTRKTAARKTPAKKAAENTSLAETTT
jgi:hypothetical protein